MVLSLRVFTMFIFKGKVDLKGSCDILRLFFFFLAFRVGVMDHFEFARPLVLHKECWYR